MTRFFLGTLTGCNNNNCTININTPVLIGEPKIGESLSFQALNISKFGFVKNPNLLWETSSLKNISEKDGILSIHTTNSLYEFKLLPLGDLFIEV